MYLTKGKIFAISTCTKQVSNSQSISQDTLTEVSLSWIGGKGAIILDPNTEFPIRGFLLEERMQRETLNMFKEMTQNEAEKEQC